jgi:type IV secretory pathway TrbD component
VEQDGMLKDRGAVWCVCTLCVLCGRCLLWGAAALGLGFWDVAVARTLAMGSETSECSCADVLSIVNLL